MNCDRCKRFGLVLKDMSTPDGWTLHFCADCREAIDTGATFSMPKTVQPPRLSKMAKMLRREDESTGTTFVTPLPRMNKDIVDSPFPATWRKK